jgi:hypothetical protein
MQPTPAVIKNLWRMQPSAGVIKNIWRTQRTAAVIKNIWRMQPTAGVVMLLGYANNLDAHKTWMVTGGSREPTVTKPISIYFRLV